MVDFKNVENNDLQEPVYTKDSIEAAFDKY